MLFNDDFSTRALCLNEPVPRPDELGPATGGVRRRLLAALTSRVAAQSLRRQQALKVARHTVIRS